MHTHCTCTECPVGGGGMGPALRGSHLKGTWGRFIEHRKSPRKKEKGKGSLGFNPGSVNNQLGTLGKSLPFTSPLSLSRPWSQMK